MSCLLLFMRTVTVSGHNAFSQPSAGVAQATVDGLHAYTLCSSHGHAMPCMAMPAMEAAQVCEWRMPPLFHAMSCLGGKEREASLSFSLQKCPRRCMDSPSSPPGSEIQKCRDRKTNKRLQPPQRDTHIYTCKNTSFQKCVWIMCMCKVRVRGERERGEGAHVMSAAGRKA